MSFETDESVLFIEVSSTVYTMGNLLDFHNACCLVGLKDGGERNASLCV